VSVAAALERMKNFDRDYAIILGRDKTYHGMVSQASLIDKVRARDPDPYRSAFLPEVEPIPAEEPLSNVLGRVASSPWPVPVVDQRNRYLGSISKSVLLETLDRAH